VKFVIEHIIYNIQENSSGCTSRFYKFISPGYTQDG